jgi:hypothetical protein
MTLVACGHHCPARVLTARAWLLWISEGRRRRSNGCGSQATACRQCQPRGEEVARAHGVRPDLDADILLGIAAAGCCSGTRTLRLLVGCGESSGGTMGA